MKIKVLTVTQARSLDERATTQYEIPPLLLMENAGIRLAHAIKQAIIPPINLCRIVLFCGTGNNGGDAFAAARHLAQMGYLCELFILGDETQMKEEAAVNYRIIKHLRLPCEPFSQFEIKQKEWKNVPVLMIDALLGTGFKQPLREPMANAIREINRFKKMHNVSVKILAVDIPSGLHGDDGIVGPDVVKADMTVSFACLKQGMVKPEARAFVGRTEVVDIGIPDSLLQEVL